MEKGIFVQAGMIAMISYVSMFLLAVGMGEFNYNGMLVIPSIIMICIFVMLVVLFWRMPELIGDELR